MIGFYLTSTSKRHPTSGWFTLFDWLNILASQNYRCIDCRVKFHSRKKYVPTVGHRVPIIRNGTNWPHNIIAQCGSCNSKQGSKLHATTRAGLTNARLSN